MKSISLICIMWFTCFIHTTSYATIVSANDDHYELRHEASSALSPDQVWSKLIQPSQWWHPDHTYSGDSKNLSLDTEAGGLWQENWQNNATVHGTVLFVEEGKTLRLNAPFGPLQKMAVTVIWTISLKPIEGGGTLVTFHEIANGSASSKLGKLADAVNAVKGVAIKRLAAGKQ